MEDLTKQQLVLLCIMVSFVASVATGIMTVSLLTDGPVIVPQVINRVVERTVETIIPAAKEIIKIPVKEESKSREEILSEVIEKSGKSIVRLTKITETGDEFVAYGIIVSTDGEVLSDNSIFSKDLKYKATFEDGNKRDLFIDEKEDGSKKLYLVRGETEKISFTNAVLGNSDTMKLGQTVLMIGGETKLRVALGIISSILEDEKKSDPVSTSTPPTKFRTTFETDIVSEEALLGSPIINMSGEVVGIRVSSNKEKASFTPINLVK
jgi:S1-C subfamily serine protease